MKNCFMYAVEKLVLGMFRLSFTILKGKIKYFQYALIYLSGAYSFV